MPSKNFTNYFFLTFLSLVIFGFALTIVVILFTSVPPTIADFLPLLIALLLGHKLYSLLRSVKKHEREIGLTVFEKVKDFLARRKIVLAATIAIGFVIWFRELVPPNIVTGVLFFFLNPFVQLSINLSAFYGRLAAELVTLSVQLWFVYLIVAAVAGLFGKAFNRGPRAAKKRKK